MKILAISPPRMVAPACRYNVLRILARAACAINAQTPGCDRSTRMINRRAA